MTITWRADVAPGPRVLYRPEEAAAVLGIGRSKIFELIADGQLETVAIGRSRRIPADALATFVEALRAGA